MANGVNAWISDQSRSSEGTQGPLETLDRGWGSCRDIAVRFAEAVRTLGFGARLVSGYLHDPDGKNPGSAGASSTNNRVEILILRAGWAAFGPTNRADGAANLILMAVARNIAQVTPVSGRYYGRGCERGWSLNGQAPGASAPTFACRRQIRSCPRDGPRARRIGLARAVFNFRQLPIVLVNLRGSLHMC